MTTEEQKAYNNGFIIGKASNGIISVGVTTISGQDEISGILQEDVVKNDMVYYNEATPFESIDNCTYGSSSDVYKFSPDGRFLLIYGEIAPYVRLYKCVNGSLTYLPEVVCSSVIRYATIHEFSPDGQYLVVSLSNDSNTEFQLYRFNEALDTFEHIYVGVTKVSYVSFSPDSKYLTVVYNGQSIVIVKLEGSLCTKLATPLDIQPTGGVSCVSWCPDSNYITCGLSVSPYIISYKRNDDGFIRVSDPDILPVAAISKIIYRPDGNQIVCIYTSSQTPYIISYKKNGDTYNRINPPVIDSNSIDVKYTPDSLYLVLSKYTGTGNNLFKIYRCDGDNFISVADPSSTVYNGAYPGLSVGDKYWVVNRYANGCCVTIYKYENQQFSKVVDLFINPIGTVYSGDKVSMIHPDSSLLATLAYRTGDSQSIGLSFYKHEADVFTKDNSIVNMRRGMTSAMSQYNEYIMIGRTSTIPYVAVYKQTVNGIIELSPPTSQPSSDVYSIDCSPDGIYWAVGYKLSPYIMIYKRNGDLFTALTNPSTLPTYIPTLKFSPDGNFLLLARRSLRSVHFVVYQRNVDTFTKLPDPTTAPAGYSNVAAFSKDSMCIMVGTDTSPYLHRYKYNGTTFEYLSGISYLGGTIYNIDFSSDNKHMAIAQYSANRLYLSVYRISGDTYTKLPNPNIIPSSTTQCVKFSNDGKYFVVGMSVPPYLMVYTIDVNDTIRCISYSIDIPKESIANVVLSSDNKYIVASGASTITIYKQQVSEIFSKVQSIKHGAVYQTSSGISFSYDDKYLCVPSSIGLIVLTRKIKHYIYKALNSISKIMGADSVGYAKQSGVVGEEINIVRLLK